jgi:hypothetical protein
VEVAALRDAAIFCRRLGPWTPPVAIEALLRTGLGTPGFTAALAIPLLAYFPQPPPLPKMDSRASAPITPAPISITSSILEERAINSESFEVILPSVPGVIFLHQFRYFLLIHNYRLKTKKH